MVIIFLENGTNEFPEKIQKLYRFLLKSQHISLKKMLPINLHTMFVSSLVPSVLFPMELSDDPRILLIQNPNSLLNT